jgi:hypothetical protein
MSRLPWRKAKTLAMLSNRRQWQREYDPVETPEQEIEIEQGGSYIVIEASLPTIPTFIITE